VTGFANFVIAPYVDGNQISTLTFTNDVSTALKVVSFSVLNQQDVALRVETYGMRMYQIGCI
jgi:hypothetical protein